MLILQTRVAQLECSQPSLFATVFADALGAPRVQPTQFVCNAFCQRAWRISSAANLVCVQRFLPTRGAQLERRSAHAKIAKLQSKACEGCEDCNRKPAKAAKIAIERLQRLQRLQRLPPLPAVSSLAVLGITD